MNSTITNDVIGTLTYWRDTYPWFVTFVRGTPNNAGLSYFGRSQEYKNKVAYRYVFTFNNYVGALQQFQRQAEIILKDLNNRLDND